MVATYHKVANCRLCGSPELELVVPLGSSPVSEKYSADNTLLEEDVRVPLDLYFCLGCTHVQLLHIVEPNYLWSDFTFKTANNPALVNHFRDYTTRVLSIIKLNSDDLIVDVGSNDGTLLSCFREHGFRHLLGVDPAKEIAEEADHRGISTKIGFMNKDMARRIVEEKGRARLVTANNVYAHVEDLSGMTDAINYLMSDDGLFVFEVSYAVDVVEKTLIGTIFHEHLSYHTITALQPFLNKHGLELIHVERGPEQGGSVVAYAKKRNQLLDIDESVGELLKLEKSIGLVLPNAYKKMSERLESTKKHLRLTIDTLKKDGASIVGFGAARAGTTLLSYFQIGKQLDYLVDDNQAKHFKYSPGDRLQVRPTSDIYDQGPDFLLILAWIHADKIIRSHGKYLEKGGRFIRVFPEVEIVQANGVEY